MCRPSNKTPYGWRAQELWMLLWGPSGKCSAHVLNSPEGGNFTATVCLLTCSLTQSQTLTFNAILLCASTHKLNQKKGVIYQKGVLLNGLCVSSVCMMKQISIKVCPRSHVRGKNRPGCSNCISFNRKKTNQSLQKKIFVLFCFVEWMLFTISAMNLGGGRMQCYFLFLPSSEKNVIDCIYIPCKSVFLQVPASFYVDIPFLYYFGELLFGN